MFFEKQNYSLIAYCNIFLKENNDVFIGIGLEPTSCGKGLGAEILQYAVNEAKQKYPNNNITLQVRAWNIRAIKCYIKAGFKIQKRKVYWIIMAN